MHTDDNNQKFSKKWSPEEDQLLINSVNKTWSELYKLFPSRTYLGIYQRFKKLGLEKSKEKSWNSWTDEDEQILKDFFGKIPNQEMELKLNRNWHTIQEYARKRGFYLNNFKDERGKTINNKNKPSLYPLTLEDNQAYYWMGYLLADGYMCHYLGQIVLASALEDREHMEKYAQFLNSTAKIYKQKSNEFRTKDGLQVRVSVADSKNAKILENKFDWKKNKTINPPEIEILNKTLDNLDKFVSYFVGFCDGDGSINSAYCLKLENFATYLSVHNFFVDKMIQFNLLQTRTKPRINKDGYSQFTFNKNCILKVKKFILDNHLIVLARKWDKINI